MNYLHDLDAPLHTFEVAKPGVKLSEEDRKKNEWTFGGIGSGKSSGSGRTLALKYLNAGFGGIDPETNELAANTIGKTYVPKATTTDKSVSLGEELQYQYLPMHFTMLRTGGEHNEKIVDAAIMTAGKRWSNGKNFMITKFVQP